MLQDKKKKKDIALLSGRKKEALDKRDSSTILELVVEPACAFILGFPPSETLRNRCIYIINCPVYGVLLQ
jgi:hypothetical protein